MKKTNTKLQLKTNTVRVLQDSQLKDVAGGAPTQDCSINQTGCSSRERCPHTAQCGPGGH